MILLDTSAVIQLLRGSEPPGILLGEAVGISTIVETELLVGVLHGGGKKERARVEDFLREVEVFDFERAAASKSAEVIAKLWKAGKPIGDFDAQIAGHALALKMPLLTDNLKHFKRVEGLDVIAW